MAIVKLLCIAAFLWYTFVFLLLVLLLLVLLLLGVTNCA